MKLDFGTIIIAILFVFLVYLFYMAIYGPKQVSMDGAIWECESCQNPNLIGYSCDYPGFIDDNDAKECIVTCADNTTIQTTCIKERLVRYHEVK